MTDTCIFRFVRRSLQISHQRPQALNIASRCRQRCCTRVSLQPCRLSILGKMPSPRRHIAWSFTRLGFRCSLYSSLFSLQSAAKPYVRPTSTGQQSYDSSAPNAPVGQAIPKISAYLQVTLMTVTLDCFLHTSQMVNNLQNGFTFVPITPGVWRGALRRRQANCAQGAVWRVCARGDRQRNSDEHQCHGCLDHARRLSPADGQRYPRSQHARPSRLHGRRWDQVTRGAPLCGGGRQGPLQRTGHWNDSCHNAGAGQRRSQGALRIPASSCSPLPTHCRIMAWNLR